MQTKTIRIDGMTCVNCQNRIEKKLKNTVGVEDAAVNFNAGTAAVTYNDSVIAFDEIKAAIERLGYTVTDRKTKTQVLRVIGTLVIILALYILLRIFNTSNLATAFPVARSGMGYGMMLIIGLVTSVHCIAMCGGINLSQSLAGNKERYSSSERVDNPHGSQTNLLTPHSSFFILHSSLLTPHSLFPAILYNSGRVISYTAVGVVVGTLGSVITVSSRFQGTLLFVAGIFMLIMGLNMLGLFPALRRFTPRLPQFFAKKINTQKTGRGPLIVGFLNGFMPCGPLQAMQVYALSTGSPLKGGLSMFLFCIGTVPLMFALGAASGILSGVKGQVFSRRVMQVGAVLVAAMGLAMFANGWNLAGLESPLDRAAAVFNPAKTKSGASSPVVKDGVQIINSTLLPNRYPAITVQQGIPVRWIINAPQDSINGCNYSFIIREYGIQHTFTAGDNVIEFLPERTGRFSYSCWMGMIRSSITVVAEGQGVTDVPEPVVTPTPAGVDIPTDRIALAQVMGNFQMVEIRLTDDGFEPAIVVMQRLLPALWNINIDSLDPGNNGLIFPVYYAILEMEQGDNPIQIVPDDDFEFSTVDNVFYGYVKVVDDINSVDIEAVKAEVAEHETLIYPEEYWEYY